MNRAVRTALGVVVALAALTACSPDQPSVGSSVGPSVTVPGPGDRDTLFGTSVYRGDATFEDALARQDAAFGRLEVARVFYPGDPPLWPGSPAAEADRPVVVSFKLPPAEVMSGQHDEALKAWFASIPGDHPVWWAYFHEPENDSEDGAFTSEEFRNAFRHVSDIAHESAGSNVKGSLILQCRTASPDSGRSFADWDPGADTYDVLGFDCYNRAAADGVYPDPAAWLAANVAAAARVGRPLALGEMGSELVDGDDGTGRAHWLESVAAYAIAQHFPFVSYFDSPITGTDYRLTDAPSQAAWRSVITGQP